MDFYYNLDYICKLKNTTVGAVCARCGISSGTASNWKKKGVYPNGSIIVALANELNVSTDALLLGKDCSSALPDDEAEILTLFRLVDDPTDKKRIARSIKDVIPKRDIKYYCDTVSAGSGIELESSGYAKKTIYLDNKSRQADFILKVDGESMADTFHDGDILLVKSIQNTYVDVGDIGIFVIDNKGFVKKRGENELISLNPDYDNIPFSDQDRIDCVGLVLGKAILIE